MKTSLSLFLSAALLCLAQTAQARPTAQAPDLVDKPHSLMLPKGNFWKEATPAEDPDDKMTPQEAEAETFLRKAKAYTMKVIAKAKKNSTDEAIDLVLESLEKSLKEARILFPGIDDNFDNCRPHVLAFVKRNYNGNIYMCARTVYEEASYRKVGQAILHEGVHTIGVHDECDTTRVEVGLMRLSGEGLAFRNGYMKRCDIE